MHERTIVRWIGSDVNEEEFEAFQAEVAAEATAIREALERSGGWRSAQDTWIEALGHVSSRRSIR